MWEIKGEDFKPHTTNREQNHGKTPGQWTPRQDGKTDVPDETHAWPLGQGKQTQEQNQTEMLREQLLGLLRDPVEIIIKMRTHEVVTTKESYPPQLIHWTCWVSLDVSFGWNTGDGVMTAHALVMEAMVSWLATELLLHATQWFWACPEIKDTTNSLCPQ